MSERLPGTHVSHISQINLTWELPWPLFLKAKNTDKREILWVDIWDALAAMEGLQWLRVELRLSRPLQAPEWTEREWTLWEAIKNVTRPSHFELVLPFPAAASTREETLPYETLGLIDPAEWERFAIELAVIAPEILGAVVQVLKTQAQRNKFARMFAAAGAAGVFVVAGKAEPLTEVAHKFVFGDGKFGHPKDDPNGNDPTTTSETTTSTSTSSCNPSATVDENSGEKKNCPCANWTKKMIKGQFDRDWADEPQKILQELQDGLPDVVPPQCFRNTFGDGFNGKPRAEPSAFCHCSSAGGESGMTRGNFPTMSGESEMACTYSTMPTQTISITMRPKETEVTSCRLESSDNPFPVAEAPAAGDIDFNRPPFRAGTFSVKTPDGDCEYKNDGNGNPGALWYGDEVHSCKAHENKDKGWRKGDKYCSNLNFRERSHDVIVSKGKSVDDFAVTGYKSGKWKVLLYAKPGSSAMWGRSGKTFPLYEPASHGDFYSPTAEIEALTVRAVDIEGDTLGQLGGTDGLAQQYMNQNAFLARLIQLPEAPDCDIFALLALRWGLEDDLNAQGLSLNVPGAAMWIFFAGEHIWQCEREWREPYDDIRAMYMAKGGFLWGEDRKNGFCVEGWGVWRDSFEWVAEMEGVSDEARELGKAAAGLMRWFEDTLVTAAGNAFTVCREIYTLGTSIKDTRMAFTSKQLHEAYVELDKSLNRGNNTDPAMGNGVGLKSLAAECCHTAKTLQVELDALRKAPGSGLRGTFKTAWLKKRKTKTIEKLKIALDEYEKALDSKVLIDVRQVLKALEAKQDVQSKQLVQQLSHISSNLKACESILAFQLRSEIDKCVTASQAQHEVTRKHVTTTVRDLKISHTEQLSEQSRQHHDQQQDDQFLNSLLFSEMHARMNDIEESHSETFHWMFEKDATRPWDSFCNWLQTDDRLYWINGKAGSGKSTLMKFLVKDPRTRDLLAQGSPNRSPLIVGFFFWLSGSEMQRSFKGFLCSIIHQLVHENRQLVTKLLRGNTGLLSKRTNGDWSKQGLQRFLSQIMDLLDRPLCIFLDGLDEFDQGDDIDQLLNLVEGSFLSATIKICISSRPENYITKRLSGYKQLRLQDLTAHDMQVCIRTKLETSRTQCLPASIDDEYLESIISIIAAKADGVFLWVYYALSSLVRGMRNEDDFGVLLGRIEELPNGMHQLYIQMWNRLNEDQHRYREEAATYFSYVATCFALNKHYPLSLFEVLVALNPQLQSIILDDLKPQDPLSLARECELLKARIITRSAGLLELSMEDETETDDCSLSNENPQPSAAMDDIKPSHTVRPIKAKNHYVRPDIGEEPLTRIPLIGIANEHDNILSLYARCVCPSEKDSIYLGEALERILFSGNVPASSVISLSENFNARLVEVSERSPPKRHNVWQYDYVDAVREDGELAEDCELDLESLGDQWYV
ncbi:MAG: hypothetical protein Q9208_000587 [Pyrenodesmia sp. 3 TL-2023]